MFSFYKNFTIRGINWICCKFTFIISMLAISVFYWTTFLCPPYLCFLGLSNSSECSPCVGGWACDVTGLTSPLRLCAGGYYCKIGADSTTPAQGEWWISFVKKVGLGNCYCKYVYLIGHLTCRDCSTICWPMSSCLLLSWGYSRPYPLPGG